MFKTKKLDLESGGTLLAVMNIADCESMNLNPSDRIRLSWDEDEIVVILDSSKKLVNIGEIGVSEDVWGNFELPDRVHVFPARKPKSLAYIRKRLFGEPLKKNEIETIVTDLIENRLSSVEATYFVASAYVQRFSPEEEETLTKAIINQGKILKFDRKPVLNKHCIGGVPGNRTTPIVIPIVAAAGYLIPKTSSRAITSPAGTADVIEIIMNVEMSAEEMKAIAEKTGAAMVWGGSVDLAPADDKLLKIRYPLKLDPLPLLVASVLAKKVAEGSDTVLIDVPIGRKVKTLDEATKLGERFIELGKRLGLKIRSVITDGSQPIGRGIGPSLEIRDVLEVLQGKGPEDLKEKSVILAGHLLEMAGEKRPFKLAQELLESGKAWKKMKEIIEAQGGDPNLSMDDIPIGHFNWDYVASADIEHLVYNSNTVAQIAREAGAPGVKGAGVYLHVPTGGSVGKGEKIITIYAEDETRLNCAISFLKENAPFMCKKTVIDQLV
ncbi:MAG: AMP phosphorylase [Candidatus Altiarchaeota archaeon]|nr:AMP phosphorylase [Candidatus Altiarchaeota archaeon]